MSKEKNNKKRIKINFDTINKGKFKPLAIDWEKIRKEDKERERVDRIRYDKQVAEEDARIKALICPCCKSTDKQKEELYIPNGPLVVGGRNSSTMVKDNYVCLGCGVMFKDLKAIEIIKPYTASHNGLFY